MHNRPITYHDFTDGTRQPVHADADGRQCVIGDDGERVYGTWLPEVDGPEEPVIVDNQRE
jgi:hypothetical protein